MSQLLFPTPDHQVLPQAQVQDHGEGHEIGSATEPITKEDKILRSIISGTIGLLIGVVQAIIVSNSLVEIANTKAFSIVRLPSVYVGQNQKLSTSNPCLP